MGWEWRSSEYGMPPEAHRALRGDLEHHHRIHRAREQLQGQVINDPGSETNRNLPGAEKEKLSRTRVSLVRFRPCAGENHKHGAGGWESSSRRRQSLVTEPGCPRRTSREPNPNCNRVRVDKF